MESRLIPASASGGGPGAGVATADQVEKRPVSRTTLGAAALVTRDKLGATTVCSKSDNLIRVKEMTATEVARNFSAVLDSAERGESVAITRGGHRVATLVPAPRANGAALTEVIRRWQDEELFDDEFESDLAWMRKLPADPDVDPWRE
jgi:prevent-host-death family protein